MDEACKLLDRKTGSVIVPLQDYVLFLTRETQYRVDAGNVLLFNTDLQDGILRWALHIYKINKYKIILILMFLPV